MISLLGSRRAVNHFNIRVPNIRKEFFFEAISALLGLPSAGMLFLGIHECLLCSEVLNVEPHHSGLICFHVAPISIPLVVNILRIMTLILFLQCACEVNEPAHILLGDDLFGRHAAKKKRAMWTPKWCLKSGPRFGAREKKKQFGGPRNGVQILHPILGSTLPIIFREVTPEKLTF